MSKRTYPLIALVLTAAVFFTAVAHACADLKSIQTIVQPPPCDHGAPEDQAPDKPRQDTCESIRHGLLSTQASYPETALSNFHSIAFQEDIFAAFSLSDLMPSFFRSHAPPFSGLGATHHLSHVVLRI